MNTLYMYFYEVIEPYKQSCVNASVQYQKAKEKSFSGSPILLSADIFLSCF